MSDASETYRVAHELRKDLWIVAVLCAMAAMAFAAPALPPARGPIHGPGGAPGAPAALLPVAMAAAVWLLLLLLPAIDPRRRSYAHFAPTYRLIRAVPVALLAVREAATLLRAGLGLDTRLLPALVMTALLLVMGNLMPRIRPTWFVGVRTPWTLGSDEVWRRTHRVAGRLFVAGAPLPLLAGLVRAQSLADATLAAVLVPTLLATAYSWWLYQRLERSPAG